MAILSHNALSFVSIISPHAAVFSSQKFKYAFNLHSIWKTKKQNPCTLTFKDSKNTLWPYLGMEFL